MRVCSSSPASDSQPGQQWPPTFPSWPQMKASQYEDSPVNRPARSCPSHSIFESRPIHTPGWMIQWGPYNCRQAEGGHVNWLRGTGFQCHLWVLWMYDPKGPPFGQVVRTRRYRRLCYPIPTDPGYTKVTMKTSCSWLYWPWPNFRRSKSLLGPKS